MKVIRRSNIFIKWHKNLRDANATGRITTRIKRLAKGNPGDAAPVGEGISEMRIHYGTGYRVYFKEIGKEIIILLCGGNKSTQQADISDAKEIARLYEEK